MADISSPREFLIEALDIVNALNAEKSQLEKLTQEKERSEKALNTLKKNIEQEKSKTINSRRSDIESEFNKKIKVLENEINKIEDKRQKARNEGVKNRVVEQTAGLKGEIANLKSQLSTFCQNSGVPGICRSKLYYRLFYPSHPADWFMIILAAVLMIGALAGAFYVHNWKYFAAAVVVDVIVIVIYVNIWSRTKGKYHEQIQVCRQVINNIIADEKAIKNITKNIHKDTDDSVYDLGSFDAELGVKKQELMEQKNQKESALYQFNNFTGNEIANEIDANYGERLQKAISDSYNANTAWKDSSSKVLETENVLNTSYVQYLGSKNINRGSIEKMIALIESGEAVSVSDAITKISAQ